MLEQFKGKIVDYHAHLNDQTFDADRDAVVARAWTHGVEVIVDMGIDLTSSKKAVGNARKYSGIVFAAIGIDPEIVIPGGGIFDATLLEISDQEFGNWVDTQMHQLHELYAANAEYVVMIGETGVDTFHLESKLAAASVTKETLQLSHRRQTQLFCSHIDLANQLKLPLSIHSRGCEQECLDLLIELKGKGILHCFTGSKDVLTQILTSGNGVGVGGIYTYRSGQELKQNILPFLQTHQDQIFFETDAPYLAPLSKRGERCEPGDVVETIELVRA